ncbi:Uncharacterised protein [Mycobacterium tuberculosis]|nr:Uncharacterised protein [Mycobacterium tuberculosis]
MSEPTAARAPRKIFVWDVRGRDAGWAGVTGDRDAAMKHVHRVLRDCGPDGWGSVHRVALDPLGRVRYVRLRTVAEAWRDKKTGAIVWRHE